MGWPTTSDPRTEFVTLRLTANEAAELDAYAAATNRKRSETVRDAVAAAVTGHKRRSRKKVALEQSNDAGA